jgi:hypothetical protein
MAYRVLHLSGSLHLRDHEEVRWVSPGEAGHFALTEPDRLLLQKLRAEEAQEGS